MLWWPVGVTCGDAEETFRRREWHHLRQSVAPVAQQSTVVELWESGGNSGCNSTRKGEYKKWNA